MDTNVSGWDSWDSSQIWSGQSANLTTCMKKCQETANCIYVTYRTTDTMCWLCQNYLSQGNTAASSSILFIGVIVQNPLITKRHY